jgi:hypothetical protein
VTKPLDLAAISIEHRNLGPHWAGRWLCAAGCESDGTDPCVPYRLTALAQELAAASFDAQSRLAWLFKDRAQDGTLSHAVLITEAEVKALRAGQDAANDQLEAMKALSADPSWLRAKLRAALAGEQRKMEPDLHRGRRNE